MSTFVFVVDQELNGRTFTAGEVLPAKYAPIAVALKERGIVEETAPNAVILRPQDCVHTLPGVGSDG